MKIKKTLLLLLLLFKVTLAFFICFDYFAASFSFLTVFKNNEIHGQDGGSTMASFLRDISLSLHVIKGTWKYYWILLVFLS